jgi:DNA mismatch repair protein MutS
MSLAWACAEALAKDIRAYCLFATHYFELTQLAEQNGNCRNVHLEAVEHGDRIVFLHQVKQGPADRSYGLHVAALAGVPQEVIRAAQEKLQQLEKTRPLMKHKSAEKPVAAAPDPVVEMLANIEPDELSPREALELLYRLKQAHTKQ